MTPSGRGSQIRNSDHEEGLWPVARAEASVRPIKISKPSSDRMKSASPTWPAADSRTPIQMNATTPNILTRRSHGASSETIMAGSHGGGIPFPGCTGRRRALTVRTKAAPNQMTKMVDGISCTQTASGAT